MEFHAFLAKGVLIFFAILSGMFGGVTLPEATSTASVPRYATSTASLGGVSSHGTGFFTPSWSTFGGIGSSTALFHLVFPHTVPGTTTLPGSSVVPPIVLPPPVIVTPTTPGTIEVVPTVPTSTEAGVHEVESAIVNILCTSKKTGFRSISGSGFIIDSKGIILTAAHVGQYFLIDRASKGADMSCVIRMGDPAKSVYKATPIYISQNWVHDNASAITEAMATGNGKNDYGILAITGSVSGESLPASFPFVSLGAKTPEQGDEIIIGTYGAEFLTSEQIRTSLSPTIVQTAIKKVYSLKVTPADLISLGASAAAQSGSSGGLVVGGGKAIGIVTTSSLGADRSARDLRAITLQHVRASYESETGKILDAELSGSIASLLQKYAETEASLAQTLYNAIK